MTEKKAAFGNNFTPEQRAAALKRAAELRAARAEYLARVKSGEVGIAAALAEGKENPVVGRIKAKRRPHGPAGRRCGKGAERHDRDRHRGVPPRRGHRTATGRKARRAVRVGVPGTQPRGKRKAICEVTEPPPIGRRLFRSSGSRYRAPRVLGTLPVRETCACAGTARVRRG